MTEARRQAGLLIPLFSCVSSTSWGIGDIGDLLPITRWLSGAGQRILQLLPINEMAPGQQSPYSAISSMAIDPIYIRLPGVPEFAAMGGEASLDADNRELLDAVRGVPAIDYENVRRLKYAALRKAFDRFTEIEWGHDTTRARELTAFNSGQAWWIEDYALFRAIHASRGERPWAEWPAALQRREPAEIDRARRELMREVLFYQYMQWQAAMEWRESRQHRHGVALFGDLPFMVDGDSADVWARQYQFRLDASIGAPPDAFSATGQNWGMPLYRWDVIAAEHFRWLHERARRSADLYDGYRVDHLVGFYRTFAWPNNGGDPFFTPPDEPTQTALGERIMAIFREAGSTIIAEDLGTVPDFVRASLERLGVPGFRVLRWERDWHEDGQPFRDPTEYPALSVAASGTHDTESMAAWWEAASGEERQQLAALSTVRRIGGPNLAAERYNPAVRDALLEALFASGSNMLLLPMIDAFGWADRVNEPATVNGANWTYRLPWSVDRLAGIPAACERQETLARWASQYREEDRRGCHQIPFHRRRRRDSRLGMRRTWSRNCPSARRRCRCRSPQRNPIAGRPGHRRDDLCVATVRTRVRGRGGAGHRGCPGGLRCAQAADRQPYRLVQTIDGALRLFEYEIDNDLFLRIFRSAAASPWVAAVLPIPKTHERAVLAGTIDRDNPSLFGAVAAAGGTVDLALALADIFSGDIDFNTELQPGDTFALVADKQLREEGAFAGYGPIFAAEFQNDGRQLRAVRFEPSAGRPAYFDERGISMRRFMLKSPLKFDPIVTSGFSRNRMHPVLGETRAHLGVDYRAPVGAPVVAVSNGVVVRAGTSGAAGRMVQLRHANGFETEYLHLSAITVRTGARVQQGELIGRVGATGLVTGPHLDYRVKRNGVFINPLTASRSMPPGEPVPAALMEAFKQVRDRELSALTVPTPSVRTSGDTATP